MTTVSETVQQTPTSTRKEREGSVRRLTLAAMLTAVVIVLQLLGSAIHVGVFSINLSLVPIVVGAAMLGVSVGAWLGLVSGLVILFSGDAALFLGISDYGTIVTVLAKGMLSGLCAALVFKLVNRWNKYAAVILAALTCPVVNTGIFLLGCRVFFWESLAQWAADGNYDNVWSFAILGLVGTNFLIELAVNIILAPAIARILGLSQDKNVSRIVYGSLLALVGFAFLAYALVLLWTQGEGSLFAAYSFEAGMNLTQRYALTAVFADLCRLSGLFLIASGLVGRKLSKKA